MSLVQPEDWEAAYLMEPGRGCHYVELAGKKVPLGIDGVPNPHVCPDVLPVVLEALRMGDAPAALRLVAESDPTTLDAPSPIGETALSAAAAAGEDAIVRALLERRCSVQQRDMAGRTPLARAAEAGNQGSVALLLAQRSDARAARADGLRPLHLAARANSPSACAAILAARADPTEKDGRGRVPLDVCSEVVRSQLAELFSALPKPPSAPVASTILTVGLRVLLLPCLGGFAGAQFPRNVWQCLEDRGAVLERVDYPGHGTRAGEAFVTSIEGLADFVWLNHVRGLTGPWAVLGHSMGAVVAYELARRVQREASTPPTAVILAAAWPPVGYDDFALRFWSQDAVENDDALVRKMIDIGGVDADAAAEPELRAMLVPVWRADLQAELGYRHSPEPRLSTQLIVVAGTEDVTIPSDEVRRWKDCAPNVNVIEMPGGHFFHLEGASVSEFTSRVIGWLGV